MFEEEDSSSYVVVLHTAFHGGLKWSMLWKRSFWVGIDEMNGYGYD